MTAATPQQFCLRWNNHQSNIISVFEQLLHSEAFVDVTLAVEGMCLKAHKVVLSACSPYFQDVLASHPDKHPIVILKDVKYSDMKDLLDFMYRGEVSVDQENLTGFLKVAESLRIKGLTEVNEKKRLENSCTSSSYLLQSSSLSSGLPTIPIGTQAEFVNAKRPTTPSPTSQYNNNKRRRGRPPKISGEESEGEVNHNSSANSTISAVDSEESKESEKKNIKIEVDDYNENASADSKPHESRTESAGPSGEIVAKEEPKPLKENCDTISRDSPGSGGMPPVTDWNYADFDHDDSNNSSTNLLLHRRALAPVISLQSNHHQHPTVTDIDQLYYTKNLLEAAMRKTPYELLKNEKAFHGSILLETLRAPMKYGFHSMYGPREPDRDIDQPPLSPHASNHLKSNHTSPTSQFPSPGVNNTNSNNNSKGSSVPIMSYCIQDNGFKCSKCFQTFTHPSNFHRHYITVHTDRRAHKCHVCSKEFKRKDNMMSHIRSVHRPGKESHNIFKDLASSSPSLSRNNSPLPEQIIKVDKV